MATCLCPDGAIEPIVDGLAADQVVIACKDTERTAIKAVLAQVGLLDRVRGIVTKADLICWYERALGPKHSGEMAVPLFAALLGEFDSEFSLADPKPIDAFAAERGYDKLALTGMWSVAEPLTRPKKVKRRG